MIAGRQIVDGGSDLGNDACPLVTVNARIGHREIAVARVQVGVADAGRDDPDQHLIGAESIQLDGVELEAPRFLFHDRGGDPHP
jgi:hypothetical protein